MSYASTILAESGLLGFWKLDEPNGATQIVDSSGNGLNSSSLTGITLGTTGGLYGDASTGAGMDGFSSQITIPNVGGSSSAISFECIVNGQANGFQQVLASKASQWALYNDSATLNALHYLQFYNGGSTTVLTTTCAPGLKHIVFTFDGNTQLLYVNGIQIDSWSGFGGVSLDTSVSNLLIGSDGASHAKGMMQMCSFWSVALSATQVRNHYAAAVRTALATNHPRIGNIYSKAGPANYTQIDQIGERMQAFSCASVLDKNNWASNNFNASAKQGPYLKSLNPNLVLLVYHHSFGWATSELGATTPHWNVQVDGTTNNLYYLDNAWFLTFGEGMTLATSPLGAIADTATHTGVSIAISAAGHISNGDSLMICDTDGVSNAEIVTVTAGGGTTALTVTRNVMSQAHFTAPAHAVGSWVRPIVSGQGGLLATNMTPGCPATSVNSSFGSQKCVDYVARVLAEKQISDIYFNAGVMDGVFQDNNFGTLTSLTTLGSHSINDVDLANTNVAAQGGASAAWATSMNTLEDKTRMCLNAGSIIAGNTGGPIPAQSTHLNGGMAEGIDSQTATGTLTSPFSGAEKPGAGGTYTLWNASCTNPPIFFFNAGTSEKGSLAATQTDYQAMRYALTACLVQSDGIFNFDNISFNSSHDQMWVYDEYSVNSQGTAVNPPVSMTTMGYLGQPTGAATQPTAGLYQRIFDNGIVYCNTNGSSKSVTPPKAVKKILGTQDATTNDGSKITGNLTIPAFDGIIVLNAVTGTVVDGHYRSHRAVFGGAGNIKRDSITRDSIKHDSITRDPVLV